jgi:hypothetical protein
VIATYDDMFRFLKARDGWAFIAQHNDAIGREGYVFKHGQAERLFVCRDVDTFLARISYAEDADEEGVRDQFAEFLGVNR